MAVTKTNRVRNSIKARPRQSRVVAKTTRAASKSRKTTRCRVAAKSTRAGVVRKRRVTQRSRKPVDQVVIRGFARVQIGEHDPKTGRLKKIVGDSGWFMNTITTDGKNSYLAAKVGSVSGSKTPTFLFLGTQTNAVNSTQTTLSGDLTAYPTATNGRKTLTASTSATGSLQMTASWSSTDNGTATTIGALGIVDVSTTASFSMAAGQTFATSAWATNQAVSATYNWNF